MGHRWNRMTAQMSDPPSCLVNGSSVMDALSSAPSTLSASTPSTNSMATNTDRTMEPAVGFVKCEHCQYSTRLVSVSSERWNLTNDPSRYPRNMEFHVERHERLNEFSEGGGPIVREKEEKEEKEEDTLLSMTTLIAQQMMQANQQV